MDDAEETSNTVFRSAIESGVSVEQAKKIANEIGRKQSKTLFAQFKRAFIAHLKKAVAIILGAMITAITIYIDKLLELLK